MALSDMVWRMGRAMFRCCSLTAETGSPALADLREEEYDSPSEDEEAALELEALTPSNTVAHPIPRGSSPVFGRSASITSSTTSRSSTLPHAPPEPAEKQQRFFCSALDVKPTTSSLGTTELPRIYREGWSDMQFLR